MTSLLEILDKLTHCQCCGEFGQCDKHRMIPGALGGKYTPENIMRVCEPCHYEIHRIMDALDFGKQQYFLGKILASVSKRECSQI